MIINISGKHMEVSDAFSRLIEKKLKKLNKYFEDSTIVKIVLSSQKKLYTMEATILFDGIILRAEETSNDMYATINKVTKKLEKQIHHHRSRLEKRLRQGAFLGVVPYEATDAASQNIVKIKRFPIKPIDIDEATMQMNLLDHSFFVFVNAETSTINVIYKRQDGDIGLLEPEY